MQRTLKAARPWRAPSLATAVVLPTALALLAALAPVSLATTIPGPAFDGATHHGPSAHALTHARIVQAPGRVIENGTLVVRDGIIVAVGADVEAPADARVWDLEGATLYPGLIESFLTVAVPEVGDDEGVPVDLRIRMLPLAPLERRHDGRVDRPALDDEPGPVGIGPAGDRRRHQEALAV